MWWLLVLDAVLLLATAFLMAARSPSHVRAWQHAVHLAVALALAVLMICLLGRVSAHYGLSSWAWATWAAACPETCS